ncbi:MAG: hypothetical protein F6J97_22430 [Leptolyngbya sp. SIO4C1]|nr:hypothetical protein [Leptolyngbya sp. SIO4C1]
MTQLIYPGHSEFQAWLAVPPPDSRQQVCYVHRPGAAVAEAIELGQIEDYLLSGEYEERLDEIEGAESARETTAPVNQGVQSDVLYLPASVVL